ncbi:MAG: hypothetical protein ABT08_09665 [Microbacterium sp. SCN 71-21]|uniref:DUF2871 domain-containing protein n=1 Tax=Microbacterium sp. SCN 71-21 TaxID=1660116 RepID=UPI00086CEED5|nr:DUF2871 domain-containing protein [Microbacterium sp. SCN 71-21]ODU76383.1 MAG: hypothetical protein ABT08_09665 [Microbacterium sp. SCN 71-21]
MSQRAVFIAASVYLVLGLAGGVYFREMTKGTPFESGEGTQLAVLHTHLLTLGFLAMLVVLVLDKVYRLAHSRFFAWFFWVYNAGLVLTVAIMTVHGTMQVLGVPASAAISGIAGLGHITLGAGLVLLLFAINDGLRGRTAPATTID